MDKKVVLVTGSSLGLGREIIRVFAKNNYNVVINYFSHEKEALELKEEVESLYNIKALTIKADISNEEDINFMKEQVLKEFNRIDVLVNNAGIAIDTTFEDKTKENFMKTLEVNLVGTFLVTKTFADIMQKNKTGKVINISSTNGIDTLYEESLDYDASKAGIINLTHNLAHHYAPFINVNCICPGWMKTPMNENLSKEFIEAEEQKILLKRFAEPIEVANVVYFLSTEEAKYINDSIIRVDGGVNNE